MNPAIVWFRNDLRLADNPALHAAASSKRPLVCVYVYEEKTSHGKAPAPRSLGAAARWWLHGSLQGLHNALKHRGGQLTLLRGATERTLLGLAAELNAAAVYSNRRYDEAGRTLDSRNRAVPPPCRASWKSFWPSSVGVNSTITCLTSSFTNPGPPSPPSSPPRVWSWAKPTPTRSWIMTRPAGARS